MIIWFDSSMKMHVDKNVSANNDFALSKYGSAIGDVVFLGNVVVDGSTATFTHFHVKANASKIVNDYWCCQSTLRKKFIKEQLSNIENAIAKHLKSNNYRKSNFNVNFEVSDSSLNLFSDLGYKRIKDAIRHGAYWNGDIYYNVMSKNVTC